MAEAQQPSPGTRLAIGAIAGTVATLALVSTVQRLQTRKARALQPPPDLLTFIIPFACGAAAGALLAVADARPGKLSGLIAGGGWWLASETGVLPAVQIGPAAARPARRAIASLAGHLAWGWSAAEAIRELGALR